MTISFLKNNFVIQALFLTVAIFGVHQSSFAGRATLTGDQMKKYSVSQSEAEGLLAGLKESDLKEPMNQRPALNTIAVYNGGTAQTEEAFNMRGRPCMADESQFQEIQKEVLNPWMKSWKEKNVSAFNELLVKDGKIDAFAVSFSGTPEKLGDLNFYKNWNQARKSANFNDYLAQFKKIDDFDILTLKYTARRDYRDAQLNMVKADLHLQFDFRGVTSGDLRRNDRGPMMVSVVKKDGKWKILDIKNWGLETLTSRKPAFEEVTQVAGVTAIPEYQRLEAIRRGGYAIAIGDVDGDGSSDLYVGSYGPGQLMLGNGKGSFSPSKNSGLGEDTLVKSATFADFNNDGNVDLLLTRFVPNNNEKQDDYHSDIVIYKNMGLGKFERVKSFIADRSPADNAMPATVGDFNEDGKLDFYVGFPGSKDFTHFGKLPEKPGIRAQGVYFNLGEFKFSENNVGDYNKKKFDQVTEHQRIYPHSAMALDFDQDGHTDIVVIDDRGNISPAYRNTGKGTFVQAEQYIGVKTAGFGMGMAAADLDNNGILDLVFTNVNFTNKYRTDQSCKSNWNATVFDTRDHGLKYYYGMKKGQFAEATMTAGLFYAGEGLGGVEFVDYNNDGWQDLYVANGLWSGTDKEQDLSHLYTRSFLQDDERSIMESRTETQSTIMKILSGYVGDMSGLKKANARPQLAGFQRNRLFRNKGDGTFIEVGYLEGVDTIADGYVIAKADVNSDGAMDLILRNADPGVQEVNFPAVQIFQNVNPGKSVRLKLVNGFNSDAIGSSAVATTGKISQYQQLIANNGTAQSERVLHFGLGRASMASKIVITWPDQKTTILTNVKPGSYTVRESTGALSSNN